MPCTNSCDVAECGFGFSVLAHGPGFDRPRPREVCLHNVTGGQCTGWVCVCTSLSLRSQTASIYTMATQLLQRRAGLTSSICHRGSALRVQCVARPSCSKSSTSSKQVAAELSSPATAFSAVASIAAPLLVPLAAVASDGSYGILEGRSVALLHPLMMFILLGATVYAVRVLQLP